jgi:N-dimethylarginine dimethylaminohydrolase
MCDPGEFGVEYSINPWMDVEQRVDSELAFRQWEALRDTLSAAGATVDVLPSRPGVPDLVFTANAALVDDERVVLAAFRHEERQPEGAVTAEWFDAQGFDIESLPPLGFQEGAGDALPFRDQLIAGHGFRSNLRAYEHLSRVDGLSIRPVRLVDPRLYHLDIVFCPLDDQTAMVVPSGLARSDARALLSSIPDPIVVEHGDALRFTANSVAVGRAVVMPHVPPAVGRALEARGFSVVECAMSEFQKAGGACRCLTLALDVSLPRRTPRSGSTPLHDVGCCAARTVSDRGRVRTA